MAAGSENRDAGADQGRVTVVGMTGYAVEITAGRHTLAADEPQSAGGTDTGPNPYDLLLAALGACKAITVRMYADRKEWPLVETRVRLAHARIHAEDCETCETKEGMVDRIDVEVEFVGALSDGQREKLHQIAGKCPVHRTLTGEIDIRSRLV